MMRTAIFAVVVPFLFSGCGGCRGCSRSAAEKPEIDPVLAAEIKLPEVPGAYPLDKGFGYEIILLVNEQGKVLLVPDEHWKDAEQNVISTLDNPAQVLSYLQRRAKEDRDQAKHARSIGKAKEGDEEMSVIILRVHKDCPFEKMYPILKAARMSGYTKYQWRVSRGVGEGQIFMLARDERHYREPEVFVMATADDAGNLIKLTIRGSGITPELDLKTDLDGFGKKLAELAAKKEGEWTPLQFEIDQILLQRDAARVIDAVVRAGFTNVWPLPIEESKR